MPDTNYLLFILLAALLLLAVLLFVFALMQRRELRSLTENLPRLQEKSEEIVLDYTEQALRDMEYRLSSSYGQDMLAIQNLLHSGQQSDMSRTEALGQRIDTALQGQDGRIRHLSDVLSERLTANDQKVDRMRDTLYQGLSSMRQENASKLDEMRKTVDENLHQTLNKRLGESFSLVNERLEQVYKGLGEMQTLANGVGDLKKVLSNVKTRGILGEIQLGAILEEILSKEQYDVNVATKAGSRDRVEFAVKLPAEDGQGVYLPIDSKFPGDLFGNLQDAYALGSAEAVNAAVAALSAQIRREAKDIRDKYIDPPNTTEFAILFLPFEGLYAEVVNRGLVEELQRTYRVNIAGPSTMAALLNSLQMGFRTFAIQKRSGEVWRVLGAVKTEFEKFGTILQSSQKRLLQVNDELDQLIGTRTRSIVRKLRSVERMDEPSAAELLLTNELPDETLLDEPEPGGES